LRRSTGKECKNSDTLDLLSNCSNRSNYEFDEKDVEQMFTEIIQAFEGVQDGFPQIPGIKEW